MIHPAEENSPKMDSSAKNPKSETSARRESPLVHVKDELVTKTSNLRMDSTPRSIKLEPGAHKTEAGSARVKTEPTTDGGRLKKESTPRKLQTTPSPHKTERYEPTASQQKPRLSPHGKGEPAETQTRFFRRETKDVLNRGRSKYGALACAGTNTSMSADGDGNEFSMWLDDGVPGATVPRRPYRLIDIGANLTHKKYATDLPQVIQRAKAAGRVVIDQNQGVGGGVINLISDMANSIHFVIGFFLHVLFKTVWTF